MFVETKAAFFFLLSLVYAHGREASLDFTNALQEDSSPLEAVSSTLFEPQSSSISTNAEAATTLQSANSSKAPNVSVTPALLATVTTTVSTSIMQRNDPPSTSPLTSLAVTVPSPTPTPLTSTVVSVGNVQTAAAEPKVKTTSAPISPTTSAPTSPTRTVPRRRRLRKLSISNKRRTSVNPPLTFEFEFNPESLFAAVPRVVPEVVTTPFSASSVLSSVLAQIFPPAQILPPVQIFPPNISSNELEGAQPTSAVERNSLCPEMFGTFANPEDCRSFYVCTWWTPRLRRCGLGMGFNANWRSCTWLQMSSCRNQTVSRPPSTPSRRLPQVGLPIVRGLFLNRPATQ